MGDSKQEALIYSGSKDSDQNSLEYAFYKVRRDLLKDWMSSLEVRNWLNLYPAERANGSAVRKAIENYAVKSVDVFPKESGSSFRVLGGRDTARAPEEEILRFQSYLRDRFTPVALVQKLQHECHFRRKREGDGVEVVSIDVKKIKTWFPEKKDQVLIFGTEIGSTKTAVTTINWQKFNDLLLEKMLFDPNMFLAKGARKLKESKQASFPERSRSADAPPYQDGFNLLTDRELTDYAWGQPAEFKLSRTDRPNGLRRPPLDFRLNNPQECLDYIHDFYLNANLSIQLILGYFTRFPDNTYEKDPKTHLMFAAYIWQDNGLLKAIVLNPEGKEWFKSLMRHHDFSLLFSCFSTEKGSSLREFQAPVTRAQDFLMSDHRNSKQLFDVFLGASVLVIIGNNYGLTRVPAHGLTKLLIGLALAFLLTFSAIQFASEHATTQEEFDALEEPGKEENQLTDLQRALLQDVMLGNDEAQSVAKIVEEDEEAEAEAEADTEVEEEEEEEEEAPERARDEGDAEPTPTLAPGPPIASTAPSAASSASSLSASSRSPQGFPPDSKQRAEENETWRPFVKAKQSDAKSFFFARGLIVGGVGLSLMTQLKAYPASAFSPLIGMMIGAAAIVIGLILERRMTYDYRMNSLRFDKNTLKDSNLGLLVGAFALTGITGLSAAMYCMPNLCAINNTLPFALTLAAALVLLVTAAVATGVQWGAKDLAVHTPKLAAEESLSV